MKYYADQTTGAFLGGFEGLTPENAVEIPPPENGGQWLNGEWVQVPPEAEPAA